MSILTINTYNFTEEKLKPNSVIFTSPGSLVGTTSPTIKVFSINTTTYALTELTDLQESVVIDTDYTFELEEGMYVFKFEGFHLSNKYYTIVGSYLNLQECLRDITLKLICNDLCSPCYEDFQKDNVILSRSIYYLLNLEAIFAQSQALTTDIANLVELTDFSTDTIFKIQLFKRVQTYCDNCFKEDCKDC